MAWLTGIVGLLIGGLGGWSVRGRVDIRSRSQRASMGNRGQINQAGGNITTSSDIGVRRDDTD